MHLYQDTFSFMARIVGNISKSQVLSPDRMNIFQYFYLRFEMEKYILQFLTGNKHEMAGNKPEKSKSSLILCVISYQKNYYSIIVCKTTVSLLVVHTKFPQTLVVRTNCTHHLAHNSFWKIDWLLDLQSQEGCHQIFAELPGELQI